MPKLNSGELHLLRLIAKDAEAGWTKCSDVVWKVVEPLPAELIDVRIEADAKFVRLTEKGRTVLEYA